ncbi:Competence/damage-inducible protein CinA C-terminal domain [Neisseria dentiae]|nr:Competence/damage-inducible protein CinA C-terminal domain [Neisseria dentiae]
MNKIWLNESYPLMNPTLSALTARLNERGQTVTCAESCTGGLLAAELTRLPGSSAWFHTGFITYSNEAKQQLLGVKSNTLDFYGAVSEETVREMALGALIAAKADYALSISGIAGPEGGSEAKPVGTVWFGLATKQRIWAQRAFFEGDRDSIRGQAVQFALAFLNGKMEGAGGGK